MIYNLKVTKSTVLQFQHSPHLNYLLQKVITFHTYIFNSVPSLYLLARSVKITKLILFSKTSLSLISRVSSPLLSSKPFEFKQFIQLKVPQKQTSHTDALIHHSNNTIHHRKKFSTHLWELLSSFTNEEKYYLQYFF